MKIKCEKEGCNALQMNDGSGFCFSHNVKYILEKKKENPNFLKKPSREEKQKQRISDTEDLYKTLGIEPKAETKPKREKRTKSIFNSPVEEEFYFTFKEYQKVFPEDFPDEEDFPQMPLATFIDFNIIKDDLTQKEKDYFFKSRIDIARTHKYQKHRVWEAIEIDGRNHMYGRENDDMKDKILELVGITIERFTSDRAREMIKDFKEQIRLKSGENYRKRTKLINNLLDTIKL